MESNLLEQKAIQPPLFWFPKPWTVHSPLFFRKIIEIERLALRAAILHKCQNYLGDGGGLVGSEKNRGTVITSLQLAFTERVVPATQAFDWSLDNRY